MLKDPFEALTPWLRPTPSSVALLQLLGAHLQPKSAPRSVDASLFRAPCPLPRNRVPTSEVEGLVARACYFQANGVSSCCSEFIGANDGTESKRSGGRRLTELVPCARLAQEKEQAAGTGQGKRAKARRPVGEGEEPSGQSRGEEKEGREGAAHEAGQATREGEKECYARGQGTTTARVHGLRAEGGHRGKG